MLTEFLGIWPGIKVKVYMEGDIYDAPTQETYPARVVGFGVDVGREWQVLQIIWFFLVRVSQERWSWPN